MPDISLPPFSLVLTFCFLSGSIFLSFQRKAEAAGLSSTTSSTTDINEASHVVLDPEFRDENLALRAQPLPRRVVSLRWLVDSFLEEKALPEEDYDLSTPVDVPVCLEEEEVIDDSGNELARRQWNGRSWSWRPEEEEEMVKFLASNLQPVGSGYLSLWKV